MASAIESLQRVQSNTNLRAKNVTQLVMRRLTPSAFPAVKTIK